MGLSFIRKNSQFIRNEIISLLKVVADFIEEKTAIDDRRHGGEVDGQVVLNITPATSQANMYRWDIRARQRKIVYALVAIFNEMTHLVSVQNLHRKKFENFVKSLNIG